MNVFHAALQDAFRQPSLSKLVFPYIRGDAQLASWFEVTQLATATMGAASAALARYRESYGYESENLELDQRLVNLWFGFTLKPIEWSLPPAWDSIAGDYKTKDGWIRLHTNAPHHKKAALSVLQCDDNRETVTKVVSTWCANELEIAIVQANGCAAQMHSMEQWEQTEPCSSLCDARFIETETKPITEALHDDLQKFDPKRPLKHIKVLDLTRVLAGPVAGRFLAAFGANVLRIDPPGWDEPGVVPEVTLGKRCATLDLKDSEDFEKLKTLLQEADVLLHGYRADAIEKLGLTPGVLHSLNPNLINVSLNAYGWNNPWENRRGFDSLVQMSSGIAHYGMLKSGANKPTPLPVQALDHATGYLMATSAIQAIELRETQGLIVTAKHSLSAIAALLKQYPRENLSDGMADLNPTDFNQELEETDWGMAQRVKFPVRFPGVTVGWGNGAVKLHSGPAGWNAS